MSRFSKYFRFAVYGILLSGITGLRAENLSQPLSAQGADAKTLVIYTATHTPYSLADSLAALKIELRRVATHVEDVAAAQVDPVRIADADYVVVFCPQPSPAFPAPVLQAIAQSQHPVLWVGYGADNLENMPPFVGAFKVAAFAVEKPAGTIKYQGREWNESLARWIPVQIPESAAASVIMSVPAATDGRMAAQPFCWKTAHVIFFSALPTLTAGCALFDDLLFDFYGVADKTPGVVGIRIDGYHCRQDHQEFRNMVKYLSEHGHPFIVGVIPAYWDAATDKVLELDSQPEFVAALRYAQQHGGRLIMEGYLHANKGHTGYEPEFWDAASDQALAEDSPEYVQKRVEQGLRQMFAKGLFPIGWQTPSYSASRADYTELAKYFSTAVERVQLSDATSVENFAGTAYGMDDYGRFIVPENLGAISGRYSALIRIQTRVEVISQLRDTISICAIPVYLGEENLMQAVTLLEKLKSPFLDLADGDHWVQTPETILLTGHARRSVLLNNARIRWQAFDVTGKLLAEEVEPKPVSGERVFECRGKGAYEIYQINQAKP